MMLYQVYDVLAEEAAPVWESPNDNTALRVFRQGAKDLGPATVDYQLYRVGQRLPGQLGFEAIKPVLIGTEVQ